MFDSIELFEILFSRRSLIISIASCKDSGIRSVQWLFLSFPRAMKRAIYLKLIASNEICVSNAKQKSGRIIFYYVLTLNVKVEFAREGEISILIPWEWSFFFFKKKKKCPRFRSSLCEKYAREHERTNMTINAGSCWKMYARHQTRGAKHDRPSRSYL